MPILKLLQILSFYQLPKILFRALISRKVSVWLKLPIILSIVYLISPFDIIPDLLKPGIGHLDDIFALIVAISIFINFIPQKTLVELTKKKKKRNPKKDQIIDAKYKIIK